MKKPDKYTLIYIGMALLSAVLLSLPFLVNGAGFLSLFAFIPLLSLERILDLQGRKGFLKYNLLCFTAWNFITTFWVCNATVAGGIVAGIVNLVQMVLIFQLFHWSKRKLKGALPYLFLAVMWMAWEYHYFDVEISWPWLTLGHAFAGSVSWVQWYEYTGVMGGSLWIWATNLSLFGLMVALSDGSWFARFNAKARWASALAPLFIIILPALFSWGLWISYEESEEKLDVVLTQPNFDPYEKFVSLSREEQDKFLLTLLDSTLAASADSTQAPQLVLAPETFVSNLNLSTFWENPSVRRFRYWLDEHPQTTLLYGASAYSVIMSSEAPSVSARKLRTGLWYESHNSAVSMASNKRMGVYHKSKLVVGTEYTPFPAVVGQFDDKYLGGILPRCAGQQAAENLFCYGYSLVADIPVAPIICYESVYGDWCRTYVQKGAKLLCVITNDAWWGDTPGYRQHLNLSRLRAIESRRWVARSANTGISAFINARGEIVEQTSWWTPMSLKREVPLRDDLTFYVTHGNMIGRISIFLFVLFSALLLVRVVLRRDPRA